MAANCLHYRQQPPFLFLFLSHPYLFVYEWKKDRCNVFCGIWKTLLYKLLFKYVVYSFKISKTTNFRKSNLKEMLFVVYFEFS